jgi:kinesin family protein 4/21/27
LAIGPTAKNEISSSAESLLMKPLKMVKPSSEECSIKVVVRTRPMVSAELESGAQCCVKFNKANGEVTVKTKTFAFDTVLDSGEGQAEVFETVSPLMQSFFEGYNATCLAYGQTGSGKTFTMGSGFVGEDLEERDQGIIQRVSDKIFSMTEQCTDKDFVVELSFLEIYNEDLHDLLAEGQGNLCLRQNSSTGDVTVDGLTRNVIQNSGELEKWLQIGSQSRHTSETKMNAVSSRSHAICTLTLTQSPKSEDEQETKEQTITSKFHLVDLAGSERAKRTGAEGAQFKEGIAINGSLFALGNVISALGDDAKRAANSHVPYRDSKLTRLLQDSLGGNSRTLMIGCISPADTNLDETYSALTYIHRARNIKNKPVINRDPTGEKILALRAENQVLRKQLQDAGLVPQAAASGGAAFGGAVIGPSGSYDWQTQHATEMQEQSEKVIRTQKANGILLTELNFCEEKLTAQTELTNALQADKDRLRFRLEELGHPVAEESEAGDGSSVLEQQLEQIKTLQAHLEEARTQYGYTPDAESNTSTEDYDLDGDKMADIDGEIAPLDFMTEEEEQLDKEQKRLEAEAEAVKQKAQDAAFEARSLKMEEQMGALDQELKDREALIKSAVKNQADMEKSMEIQKLVTEHNNRETTLKVQLQKLKEELQNHMSRKGGVGSEQVKALRAREKRVEDELRKVQLEKAKLHRAKLQQAKKAAEIDKMHGQIDNIKRDKVQLRRKIDRESKEQRIELQKREQALARAKKAEAKKEAELRQLRQQHQRQVAVFQRKIEHDAAFKKRVSDKEASRRVLKLKERRMNTKGGKALCQVQLTQLQEHLEDEVELVQIQDRYASKIEDREQIQAELQQLQQQSAAGKPSMQLHRTQAELKQVQGEIDALQTQLLEVRAVHHSSAAITDLLNKGNAIQARGIARGLYEKLVDSKVAQSKLTVAVGATKGEVFDLKKENLSLRQSYEEEKRTLLDQLEETQVAFEFKPSKPAAVSTDGSVSDTGGSDESTMPELKRSQSEPTEEIEGMEVEGVSDFADANGFTSGASFNFGTDGNKDDEGDENTDRGNMHYRRQTMASHCGRRESLNNERRTSLSGAGAAKSLRKKRGATAAGIEAASSSNLTPSKEKRRKMNGKRALDKQKALQREEDEKMNEIKAKQAEKKIEMNKRKELAREQSTQAMRRCNSKPSIKTRTSAA